MSVLYSPFAILIFPFHLSLMSVPTSGTKPVVSKGKGSFFHWKAPLPTPVSSFWHHLFRTNNLRTAGIGGNRGGTRHRHFNQQSFFALPMGFTTGSKKAVHCQLSTFPKNPSRCPFVPLAITSPNPISHRHTGGHAADKRFPSLRQGQQGQFFASPPKNCHYRHFFHFYIFGKSTFSPISKVFPIYCLFLWQGL